MTSQTPDPEPDSNQSGAASVPPQPVPAGDSQSVERYITVELRRAATNLRNTQIAGAAILLLLGGYVLYVTNHFTNSMRPHNAAEIAEGMINQQVDEKLPEIAAQLKVKIPEYIAQTPDYALDQLPKYRLAAEDRVESELNNYCRSTSQQLGSHLDTYLDQHKSEIKEILATANDKAAIQAVGQSLKLELLSYLREKPQNGEALGDQIDRALTSLQEVQKKMHHLAVDKNLTPQEKQTRCAIAILTKSIDKPGMIARMPIN